ncbi:AMP-binding protein [Paenibacillus sp. FSL H8-0537]|uniref:AMP-binding protein n=1 Tax=Paenibacillus sp. FSL H8-0537 TaxID=2921399 RepID=UPI003101ADE4
MKRPDKTAIRFKEQEVTYMALIEKVECLGVNLSRWLEGFEYPIGLYIGNHSDFIIGYYGMLNAKKVVHLVDSKWGQAELSELITHTHLGGFLIRTDEVETFPLSEWIEAVHTHDGLTLITLRAEYLSKELNAERLEGIVSCRYSSGTTGAPKCMMYEERNVWAAARNWSQSIELNECDIVYCAAYLTHGLAFNTSILAPLKAGATIVLHQDINPRSVLKVIEKSKATIFVAFPVLYDLMTTISGTHVLRSLRMCVSSGTVLHESIKRKFKDKFAIAISDLYGVAETGLSVLSQGDDYQSVGYPLQHVKIRILSESGHEQKSGESGEIAVWTESRARAYYNYPDILEGRLLDGYYLSGDIGYLSEAGKLYIVGRKSDFIDVAGKKVDPYEVENVLKATPGIKDVAVFGLPNKSGSHEIVAVALVADKGITREQIVVVCQSNLTSYKWPQAIYFVDEIPRNNNGKVLREKLRKKFAEEKNGLFYDIIKTKLTPSGSTRRLWIGNVEVERFWKDKSLLSLPGDKISRSQAIVNKMGEMVLFLAGPDDVVCLNHQPDEQFLAYVKRFRGGNLPKLVIRESGVEELNLTESLLEDPHFLEALKKDIDPNVCLIPYGTSVLEEELAQTLNMRIAAPSAEVCVEVNSKAYSRRLCEQEGIRQVPGCVGETLTELEVGFRKLIPFMSQGKLVIKDAMGVSGKGMVQLDSETSFENLMKMMRRSARKAGHERVSMLIEQWISKEKDLNYQILVTRDGHIELLSVREAIVRDGVHMGHMYPVSLTEQQSSALEDAVMKIGRRLIESGFFGIAGIDAMIGCDGHLYPCLEINARFNMATYQNRILQEWMPQQSVMMAVPIYCTLRENISFESVRDALGELLYYPGRNSGVLIHAFSTLNNVRSDGQPRKGRMHTLIIGKTFEECQLLSSQTERLLERLVIEGTAVL